MSGRPEQRIELARLRRLATPPGGLNDHSYSVGAVLPSELMALVRAAEALSAIRKRIPVDVENEDANGWGLVDKALEVFDA